MLDGCLYFHVLTDGQWALFSRCCRLLFGRRGRPSRDDRRVVAGIIHHAVAGSLGGMCRPSWSVADALLAAPPLHR